MILEFQTQSEAQACLDAINQMAAAWWQSQGYNVADGELISKRRGVDDPTSTRTVSWDTVKESPDGTFYITSLTNTRPEWAQWKQILAANYSFTAIGTEREIPEAWVPEDQEY
jgi:hypothetical protein